MRAGRSVVAGGGAGRGDAPARLGSGGGGGRGAAGVRRAGQERDAGVQALKAAGAAVAAWALVGWWWQAPMALMAPWTAVALVQGTVYRSVRTGVQQLALITAGTLLAAGAALATGSVMGAIALALPPAALLGAHNRFGDQGVYAPTTVIFVLAYGTFSGYDIAHRLGEAVVGAAIGIGVNALLLPPVHLRGVREALATMAGESTGLLRQMADDVESGCDEADARRWKDRAGSLTATLEGLRSARTWSRESYRFNPGHRMRRGARRPPPIEHDLYWERFMERLAALVDNLAAGAGGTGISRCRRPPGSVCWPGCCGRSPMSATGTAGAGTCRRVRPTARSARRRSPGPRTRWRTSRPGWSRTTRRRPWHSAPWRRRGSSSWAWSAAWHEWREWHETGAGPPRVRGAAVSRAAGRWAVGRSAARGPVGCGAVSRAAGRWAAAVVRAVRGRGRCPSRGGVWRGRRCDGPR
ncbi:hypothetical protein ACFQ60_41370 [Streptomyces zhihengii]